jgi:hypothetical protein
MRGFVVAIGLALLLATSLQLSASAKPAAPRLFDQTLFCETALIGGVREMSARAHRGTLRDGSEWHRPPFAGVASGKVGDIDSILDNHLAWVIAGRPAADALVVELPYTTTGFPVSIWGTLAWNTKRCRATAKRIPLVPRGLSGGAAGPFDDEFDCSTPRRVVVRLQATLQAPTPVRRNRRFTRITASISEARIAVRTEAGRPIAYAEVLASGRARVFTGGGCFPQ